MAIWYQSMVSLHMCVRGLVVVWWYGMVVPWYHTIPPYHMYHIDRHGTHIQYPYQLAPARHQ